jgi:thiol-disulfide isomerase/thioredoxin
MMGMLARGTAVLLLVLGPWVAEAVDLPKGVIAVETRVAPPFRLADMDGAEYALEASRGRWAFVHFWASWCGPCRREMPAIQRMIHRVQSLPLDVEIVNTAEDADTIFEFLAAFAPELDTLMDRDGLVTEAWRPRGLPATYLVDPEGRIRYQALGGRPWDEPAYLEFLERLMQGASG